MDCPAYLDTTLKLPIYLNSIVPVFDVVQAEIQRICRRNQRHNRSLLQLVVHDGRVRLAGFAHSQSKIVQVKIHLRCISSLPRGRVPHDIGQRDLRSAHAHGRNAHAATEQLVGQDEKATAFACDRAGEFTRFRHVRHAVEQVRPRNAHVVEPERAVVHTIDPNLRRKIAKIEHVLSLCVQNLVAHVPDLDPRKD